MADKVASDELSEYASTITNESRISDLEAAVSILLMYAITTINKIKVDKADMVKDMEDAASSVIFNQTVSQGALGGTTPLDLTED